MNSPTERPQARPEHERADRGGADRREQHATRGQILGATDPGMVLRAQRVGELLDRGVEGLRSNHRGDRSDHEAPLDRRKARRESDSHGGSAEDQVDATVALLRESQPRATDRAGEAQEASILGRRDDCHPRHGSGEWQLARRHRRGSHSGETAKGRICRRFPQAH